MTRLEVLSFTVGDVDEPELVMDLIVKSRLKSKRAGVWVLDNAEKIEYNITDGDDTDWGKWYYRVRVYAHFADAKLATEYKLRFE
jgi:hypothetical protein